MHFIMVDWRAHNKAHKLEKCPACGGIMRLRGDTYICQNDKCGHFEQDPSLHDVVERDGGHLKFCHCGYCVNRDNEGTDNN